MSKRERQRDGSSSSSSPMGYYSNNVNASSSSGTTHSHHSYIHSYSGYGGGGGDPEIANKKRKMQFGKSANIHIPQNNHSSTHSGNHGNSNNYNNKGRNIHQSNKKPKTSNPDTKMEELFRKLDPLVPKEAQRMKTRSKMIEKGKNTVGYDEYTRRVPKSSRRLCVEHPRTPDHHLDLPNRRWLGLVKTWRKTLHQYDPKDLSSDLFTDPAQTSNNNTTTNNNTTPNQKTTTTKMILKLKPKTTVREEQIAKATTQGLQVDFASPVGVAHAHGHVNNEHANNNTNTNTNEKHNDDDLDENDPNESQSQRLGNCNYNYYHNDDDATAFVDCTNNQGDDEIDKWEHEKDHNHVNQNTHGGGEEDDLIDFDDDSDDDLL